MRIGIQIILHLLCNAHYVHIIDEFSVVLERPITKQEIQLQQRWYALD